MNQKLKWNLSVIFFLKKKAYLEKLLRKVNYSHLLFPELVLYAHGIILLIITKVFPLLACFFSII